MDDGDRPKLVALPFTPKRATDEAWDPLAALHEFVADVAAGKATPVNIMIFWIEVLDSGRRVPRYWHANVSVLEQIGYGELIKTMAMDDWRDT